MKKITTIFILTMSIGFANITVGEKLLDNTVKKQSYAIGYNIGSNLKQQGVDIDIDAFVQAISDSLNGNTKMTPQEIEQVLNDLSQRMREKQQQANQDKAKANEKEGIVYLAENKKDKDVQQTTSGLQYKIIRLGKGKKPKATDRVKVHYAGTFIDGKEFDSSYKRGNPTTFGVTQVIPGWTEVLQLMPVGSKFQVAIPGKLAYGLNAPPSIGPNRTLLFDIELLAIE